MIKTLSILYVLLFSVKAFSQLSEKTEMEKNLYKHVSALAHDSMQGRLTGSVGMYKSAAYIRNQFIEIGLTPVSEFDNYEDVYEYEGSSAGGLNIIGAIRGKSRPDELVIFSAHYDHVGTKSSNLAHYNFDDKSSDDTIYNGANDDATGIAAMLEIARAIISDSVPPNRTIVFIAFSGEEAGLLGSMHFKNIITNPRNIVANLSLEMLGLLDGKGIIVTGDNLSDCRKRLNANLKKTNLYQGKYRFLSDKNVMDGLFYRSDNYPFSTLGIVSHCLLGGLGKKYYHTEKDEVSTINFGNMSEAVNMIIAASRPLLFHQVFEYLE